AACAVPTQRDSSKLNGSQLGPAYAGNVRITLAGFPTAKEYGGISRVTTEQAPITAPSLMVTPFRTLTLNPIHTLSAIVTGACATWVQSFRPRAHSRTSFSRLFQWIQ